MNITHQRPALCICHGFRVSRWLGMLVQLGLLVPVSGDTTIRWYSVKKLREKMLLSKTEKILQVKKLLVKMLLLFIETGVPIITIRVKE